jgi:hypothetical protein
MSLVVTSESVARPAGLKAAPAAMASGAAAAAAAAGAVAATHHQQQRPAAGADDAQFVFIAGMREALIVCRCSRTQRACNLPGALCHVQSKAACAAVPRARQPRAPRSLPMSYIQTCRRRAVGAGRGRHHSSAAARLRLACNLTPVPVAGALRVRHPCLRDTHTKSSAPLYRHLPRPHPSPHHTSLWRCSRRGSKSIPAATCACYPPSATSSQRGASSSFIGVGLGERKWGRPGETAGAHSQ